jgi:3-oxoacyl-[acyl-carrier protein] reductase
VREEDQVARAFAEIMKKFGRVDVLVNNAGISRHKPLEEMTLELFEEVMKTNVTGIFLCCRAVAPIMKKQGRGKIVNIASLGGRTGRPGVGVNYAASKAAVIAITQTLARELGPSGIYVNAIAPGPILTEQTRQYPPEVFAKWNAGRAVEKDGVPEHKHDKEEEVMFFLQGSGKFITEDREIPIEPGIAIYNPPGKTHKILNTGSEVLRFVWIYAPQLAGHRK